MVVVFGGEGMLMRMCERSCAFFISLWWDMFKIEGEVVLDMLLGCDYELGTLHA